MNDNVSTETVGLHASGLSITRPDGVPILRDAELRIGSSEVVLLVGPSGCGKSTLLLLLGGLLDRGNGWLVSGRLSCGERTIDLAEEQAGVGGVVFQSHALFDELDAEANLRIARDHAAARVSPSLIAALLPMLEDIDPHQAVSASSGGQRQRLAIARTVLSDQPVLLFDEPNSGLDILSSRRLVELIRGLCRTMGKPALIAVHHASELLPLADRVLVMDAGRARLTEVAPRIEALEAGLARASGLAAPDDPPSAQASGAPGLDTSGPHGRGPAPEARPLTGRRWRLTDGPTSPVRFSGAMTPPQTMPVAAATAGAIPAGAIPAGAIPAGLIPAGAIPPEEVTSAQARRARLFWFGHYVLGYLWLLCASPVMLMYIAAGAAITGFVTIWFGFNYYSYGGLLKSLLHDETLVGLGTVQARVALPLITTILFVARNSAVIAADVGNRVLTAQFQAMDNLGIPGRLYVFSGILISTVVGSVILLVLSMLLGAWASQETWMVQFPNQYRELFRSLFFRNVLSAEGWPTAAMGWVVIKAAISGLLASITSILIALGPKDSSLAVSRSVANAIVVGVIVALLVNAVISALTAI